jgi:hypothetical protein
MGRYPGGLAETFRVITGTGVFKEDTLINNGTMVKRLKTEGARQKEVVKGFTLDPRNLES